MGVYIVIAGESQCESFAQICLIADYLSQQLPSFCYERIEKLVMDWPQWLCKINVSNNWHHVGSPIIWKELVVKGSKPYYIGGAPEFLEYIHSYYDFDLFMGIERYSGLTRNFTQFKKKIKQEEIETKDPCEPSVANGINIADKSSFVICISGAACPLARTLLSRLLEMGRESTKKTISKIYIYDENCSADFLEGVENECSHIGMNFPGKVVKYTDRIGKALTNADLLIVLDHVPFDPKKSVGEWLKANRRVMESLAIMINASASRSMYIILANLGPSCFNATVLMHSVTVNVKNIVVATSDLGLGVISTLAEVTEVSARQIFCPPVWGFVGINHLVDVHTTVHKYNTFEPYTRYTKIRNSTLTIGTVTPEARTMEYLTYFDDTIWVKMAEKHEKAKAGLVMPVATDSHPDIPINKAIAVINLIKIWLIDPANTNVIITLGILCDGSFGLTFDGAFSQPAKLVGKQWQPATDFFMPKDKYMKLPYMQEMAEMCMTMDNKALPPLVPYSMCTCPVRYYKKKEVW